MEDDSQTALPIESEEGSVEYKLVVCDLPRRVESLKTQMSHRLLAGDGEATYWVGVLDNGVKIGVIRAALDRSIATLRTVAHGVGAEVIAADRYSVEGPLPEPVHHRLDRCVPADCRRWYARLRVVRLANYQPPPLYLP